MATLDGGKVQIRVTPDTRGFREQVLQQLRWVEGMDVRVPVSFDPDRTRLDEEMRYLDGRNLTQHVDFDPQTDRLDEALRRLDSAKDGSSVRVDADTSRFDQALDRMMGSDQRFRQQAGRPLDMGLDRAIHDSQRLADKQDTVRNRIQRLTGQADRYKLKLAQTREEMNRLANSGSASTDRLNRLQNTIQSTSSRLARTSAAISKADHDLASLDRQSRKSADAVRKLSTEWMRASHIIGGDDLTKVGLPTGAAPLSERIASRLREQTRAISEQEHEAGQLKDAIESTGRSWEDYGRHLSGTIRETDRQWMDAKEGITGTSRAEQESVRALREQVRSLTRTMETLQRTHPFGVGNNNAFRQAQKQVDEARDALDRLAMHGRVDMDSLERSFGRASQKLDDYKRRIDALDRKQVAIDFTTRNYEHVTDQIQRLEHERIDVPVELRTSLAQIQRRWRELKHEAEAGKDIRLDMDLDLKTRKAREEIDRFQRRNNELKMDLDLETALARIHMAEFTRPRTVDIFARFHGTDLGKILSGATYGATGLGALNDQFGKLVSLFDKIDKRVPMYSALANVFTSIGAGAVSLTQATLGLGAGLVTLSKAAFAAPSALLGVGSAFLDLRLMVAANSKALQKYFSGIGEQLESGFRMTGNRGLEELNRTVMPQTVRGLKQVAAAEGTVFNQLVSSTNRAINGPLRQLPHIFDDTSRAIRTLSPGLSGMWTTLLSLGSDTSKYLPRMAGWVDNLAIKWSAWLRTAERTGRIDAALEGAIQQGHLLVQSMKDAISFSGGLWRALNPKSHGLEGFESTLASMSRAVNSVRFQSVMGAWSKASQQAAHEIRGSFRDVSDAAAAMKAPVADAIRESGNIMASVLGQGSRLLAEVSPGVRDLVRGASSGLESIIGAFRSASPAIRSLLTMVGEMSRTFGGTFAATLRATGPLIRSIADAATAAAKAFDALPEPIRAMIGMYATWGRAGAAAFRSLKQGVMENIQQMLQYRSLLQQAGVSADRSGMKLRDMVRAWHAVRFGDDAAGIGILSRSLNGASEAASQTTGKLAGIATAGAAAGTAIHEAGSRVSGVAAAGAKAGEALGSAGRHAGFFRSALSVAKGVFSDFVDLAGGPWGIGVTAAFGAASAAVDNFQEHAQKAAESTQRMVDAVKRLSDVNTPTDKVITSALGQATQDPDKIDRGFGAGNNFMNWLAASGNKYDRASDAMKRLGISQSELNGYFERGSAGVKRLNDRLGDMIGKGTETVEVAGTAQVRMTDQAQAASTLSASVGELKKAYDKARQGMADWIGGSGQIGEMQQRIAGLSDQISLTVRANGGAPDRGRNLAYLKDLASQEVAVANSIQSNVAAYGSQAAASQQARNAIQQYRDSMVSQLEQAGMSEQAANRLADSLGLTASKWNQLHDVTQDTADDFMRMSNVTGDVKSRMDNAISNGTITKWKDFQRILKDLEAHPDHKIVFTADGRAVTMTAKQMKAYGVWWDGRRFVSKFDARDLTGDKYRKVVDNWTKAKLDIDNLAAILNADPTKAMEDIGHVKEEAKALGLKPATIRLLTSGADLTRKQLEDVENQLRSKGLNDKQIRVALTVLGLTDTLNKLDHASRNVKAVPKAHNTNLSAHDGVSGKAKNATRNVNAVPKAHNTNLSASGNASSKANAARNDITRIPLRHGTTLSATDHASGTVRKVMGAANRLPSQKTIHITTVWDNIVNGVRNLWNSYKNYAFSGHASGGRIHGPGSETSDSIPAMLSNNEMVLKASSVHKLDAAFPGLLDRMNEVGDLGTLQDRPLRLAQGTVSLNERTLDSVALSEGSLERMLERTVRRLSAESGDGRVKYVQNVTNNLHTSGSQNVEAALLASRMRGQTQDLLNVGGGF